MVVAFSDKMMVKEFALSFRFPERLDHSIILKTIKTNIPHMISWQNLERPNSTMMRRILKGDGFRTPTQ
jgi:hypothetical protein